MIEHTEEEWDEIRDKLNWLDSLEAAGVDIWDGISFAHELYEETYADKEYKGD